MSTFVLISPTGKYAITCYHGGGFGDQSHNQVNETDNLNYASIFDDISRRGKPYKYALQQGFIEIPAYATRVVALGSRPE